MATEQGGCLCGGLRYEANEQPSRVTICHCKFCQRSTGSAFLVEPIFNSQDVAIVKGSPKIYDHKSDGSGKDVHIHFCDTCGTKLFLTFERFVGIIGVYASTFDDPNWFDLTPENAKHIFLGVAQRGAIIPPHMNTFIEHATEKDGTPILPTVLENFQVIGSK